MSKVYMYVVDRDYGFAPNPFHGYCTLATCKPIIRRIAKIEDWIIGMGGSRLKATGKCIFAMRVTEKLTFNQYWTRSEFMSKKPVRNGSSKMMVGDNIYFYDDVNERWNQSDSHHSHSDGSVNLSNLRNDTQTNNVIVSNHFFYFGCNAPLVPDTIIKKIAYRNGRGHRVYGNVEAAPLVDWLESSYNLSINQVDGDPFNFDKSEKRYSFDHNKVI